MAKALICVDFENEWITRDSDYYVGDISDVVARTNKVIDCCRKEGYRIIFTRHIEKDSDKEFAEGSRTQIMDEIHRQESDIVIDKYRISPFYRTELEKHLEDVDEIVVCGILTNLCVRSLVQDAYDRDFDIKVIKDCCKAFDDETHEFTIKDLKETREEIGFMDSDDFLAGCRTSP